MKKTYIIIGIDCANCSYKIENELNKSNIIKNASINFLTEKLVIEYEGEENLEEVKKIIKKVDKHVEIK